MLQSLWRRVFGCTFFLVAGAAAAPPAFALKGDPLELVQDANRFTSFARIVATETDARLRATPEATKRKQLLALRVHLALHLREDELALRLAGQIRASQSDPAERAHSGLTTQALVHSQRDPIRFEREFTRLLQELPRDARTRAVLVRARKKIEEMSSETLLADLRENVAPRLTRGEPCTLEMADQLVRAGHRLRNILPLRAAMLRAYSAALAAQS